MLLSAYLKMHPELLHRDEIPHGIRKHILELGDSIDAVELIDKCLVVAVTPDTDQVNYSAVVSKTLSEEVIQDAVNKLGFEAENMDLDRDVVFGTMLTLDPEAAKDEESEVIASLLVSSLAPQQLPRQCLWVVVVLTKVENDDDCHTSVVSMSVDRGTLEMIAAVTKR